MESNNASLSDSVALRQWLENGTVSEGYLRAVAGDTLLSVSPHEATSGIEQASPMTAIIIATVRASVQPAETTLGSKL